jgi:general secretion pathway protein D
MRKIIVFSLFLLLLWGCTTLSQDYKLGTQAALDKDWDEAIAYFEKAVLENPKNSYYRLALVRARITASQVHLTKARKLAMEDKKEEALKEYARALSYDPTNIRLAEEARMYAQKKPDVDVAAENEFEPPVKLLVRQEEVQLRFVRANLRSIFEALGKNAGINVLFDELFKSQELSIDLSGMSFEDALTALTLASKSFYRIVNEKTIIIVPDRPDKRIQYEVNAIKTFYLSNINALDIQSSLLQLLRSQYKGPQIFVDKELNSLTIRDVPQVVKLAGEIITLWDKPKAEVVLDLEIMEVKRQRLKKLGLDLSNHLLGFQYSDSESDEAGWIGLDSLDFSKTENFQISLPTSLLQFLETDVDTKMIAQPRLRGIAGQKISYLVGDQIPVPMTTFTPIAAGGVNQQPVTSFEYKDVGIDIKITPTVHFEDEVTLELELKIKSLGGTGYADLPIISTREIINVIRLKEGETNLLAGLLKDEERKTKKGIFGIKNIPLLGDLFSSTDETIEQTDVILTITPYIIRRIPLTAKDLKPLWINVEGSGSSTGGRLPERGEPTGLEPLGEREQRMRGQERAEQQDRIYLSPDDFQIQENREFRVSVNAVSQEKISNMTVILSFDPQLLELKDVIRGGWLAQSGGEAPFLEDIDNSAGVCTLGISSSDIGTGMSGRGVLATLVFQSRETGTGRIMISSVSANATDGKSLEFQTQNSQVRVK